MAQRTLDAIEAAPDSYPNHPFAKVAGVRRALFIRPPKFPFAFVFLTHPKGHPYVVAAEHLRREPLYWAERLQRTLPEGG